MLHLDTKHLDTPIHPETEMSYAIIKEYSQEYFQPAIVRKKYSTLGGKNNILNILNILLG